MSTAGKKCCAEEVKNWSIFRRFYQKCHKPYFNHIFTHCGWFIRLNKQKLNLSLSPVKYADSKSACRLILPIQNEKKKNSNCHFCGKMLSTRDFYSKGFSFFHCWFKIIIFDQIHSLWNDFQPKMSNISQKWAIFQLKMDKFSVKNEQISVENEHLVVVKSHSFWNGFQSKMSNFIGREIKSSKNCNFTFSWKCIGW